MFYWQLFRKKLLYGNYAVQVFGFILFHSHLVGKVLGGSIDLKTAKCFGVIQTEAKLKSNLQRKYQERNPIISFLSFTKFWLVKYSISSRKSSKNRP